MRKKLSLISDELQGCPEVWGRCVALGPAASAGEEPGPFVAHDRVAVPPLVVGGVAEGLSGRPAEKSLAPFSVALAQ